MYTGDAALITQEWDGSVAGYDLVVSPRDEDLLSAYAVQWILGDVTQFYFKGQSSRSAQPHINSRELSATLMPVPNMNDQKKVADYLTSVNVKIAAEEDRLSALQALFKSMLHQLMTGQIRLLRDDGIMTKQEATHA